METKSQAPCMPSRDTGGVGAYYGPSFTGEIAVESVDEGEAASTEHGDGIRWLSQPPTTNHHARVPGSMTTRFARPGGYGSHLGLVPGQGGPDVFAHVS